ncbi:MAG: serine hydrolase [Verrucomicrobiota bacterium]
MDPVEAVESVFPGEHWQQKKPGEIGLDKVRLKAFRQFVGGRGCVIRKGYLVYSWGDISRRQDIASAAKPIYSHFLFKAVQDGRISSLDEKVVKWEPRLQGLNSALSYKDRLITWRHLANQTSCYQVGEQPGSAFNYNDWQMALFWDTLFLQVYQSSYEEVDEKVFRALLAEPMGCQDEPTMLSFGQQHLPGRVAMSVRDFARFGLLYLNQGKWGDETLIDSLYACRAVADPVAKSVAQSEGQLAEVIAGQRTIGSEEVPDNQSDHFGSYSWLWWINGEDREGQRMFPDAPLDLYGAFGHGGPRALWVIPSLDMVVCYNGAKMEQWVNGKQNPTNQAMKLLLEAVE